MWNLVGTTQHWKINPVFPWSSIETSFRWTPEEYRSSWTKTKRSWYCTQAWYTPHHWCPTPRHHWRVTHRHHILKCDGKYFCIELSRLIKIAQGTTIVNEQHNGWLSTWLNIFVAKHWLFITWFLYFYVTLTTCTSLLILCNKRKYYGLMYNSNVLWEC